MEQIEIKDEALSAYLREAGHDTLGWFVKDGVTTNFFANSRPVRADIRRFRRTSGESISNTDVEPVDEDFAGSDSYAPAIESCAKIRGLCEDILKAGHTPAPNTGTRISTLNQLANALIRE
jgi:hypothetical protein